MYIILLPLPRTLILHLRSVYRISWASYLPAQKPATNLSSKYWLCLPMSLGFQFLRCFGKKFHKATTSWWRNTTWRLHSLYPQVIRASRVLAHSIFFFFFTETIQIIWSFCDYPFLKHLRFHSVSFVKWGQYTVLQVRPWLNLHCGVIMFSVQFSGLSRLISSTWFAFLIATKQKFPFTNLSKALWSCSWIAILSSQPIPDICEVLPYVYHFMLKFMPEFLSSQFCTALLKSLSTFILATLNNFPSNNLINFLFVPFSTQICIWYSLLPLKLWLFYESFQNKMSSHHFSNGNL